jgi:hypothetical protein
MGEQRAGCVVSGAGALVPGRLRDGPPCLRCEAVEGPSAVARAWGSWFSKQNCAMLPRQNGAFLLIINFQCPRCKFQRKHVLCFDVSRFAVCGCCDKCLGTVCLLLNI